MKRAILVQVTEQGVMLFPQTGPGADVVAPSCATRRWAEVRLALESVAPDRMTLRCERAGQDSEAMCCPDINPEYGRAPELYVAPDFGCVQWEGK